MANLSVKCGKTKTKQNADNNLGVECLNLPSKNQKSRDQAEGFILAFPFIAMLKYTFKFPGQGKAVPLWRDIQELSGAKCCIPPALQEAPREHKLGALCTPILTCRGCAQLDTKGWLPWQNSMKLVKGTNT